MELIITLETKLMATSGRLTAEAIAGFTLAIADALRGPVHASAVEASVHQQAPRDAEGAAVRGISTPGGAPETEIFVYLRDFCLHVCGYAISPLNLWIER